MTLNRPLLDVVLRRQPVTLPPEAKVQEACRAMREHRIGAVLVTDQAGRLLGIFTGRDAVCRMLAEGHDPAGTCLKDVMTPTPASLGKQARAIEALRLMQDRGCRHVPIVEGGRVCGIVSRGDFRGGELERLEEETNLWERL
ncbi:CBS domain-containing protein [Siccirubricoccus phaeus]|uniref:CBS domain-containing protein n=1 Tax=Siccirubricoccus phaeus TaxID=2595053 RepID=UPI0011F315EE|nr:CBS domain-containing protein [Siccirubricoccus phaeus]